MNEIFTEKQFLQLSDYIKQSFGIVYGHNKKDILATRVKKIILKYDLQSFDELLQKLNCGMDSELREDFANAITVNKTDFFREIPHFEYILNNHEDIRNSNPCINAAGEIRVWSAACSTGEEPYSIAMVLKEVFYKYAQIKILATDIDTNVLRKAQNGIYSTGCLTDIPKQFSEKYMSEDEAACQVSNEIRNMISFRQFNLMDNFPFKKKFDLIFCRNVMIYFERETQIKLIHKFHASLNPGGLLFTGHSETMPDKSLKFKYIRPAIYKKI